MSSCVRGRKDWREKRGNERWHDEEKALVMIYGIFERSTDRARHRSVCLCPWIPERWIALWIKVWYFWMLRIRYSLTILFPGFKHIPCYFYSISFFYSNLRISSVEGRKFEWNRLWHFSLFLKSFFELWKYTRPEYLYRDEYSPAIIGYKVQDSFEGFEVGVEEVEMEERKCPSV